MPTGVIAGLMNKYEYNNLTTNTSLNFMKSSEGESGILLSYEGTGSQTLYGIMLNTNNVSASASFTLQVSVLQ